MFDYNVVIVAIQTFNKFNNPKFTLFNFLYINPLLSFQCSRSKEKHFFRKSEDFRFMVFSLLKMAEIFRIRVLATFIGEWELISEF